MSTSGGRRNSHVRSLTPNRSLKSVGDAHDETAAAATPTGGAQHSSQQDRRGRQPSVASSTEGATPSRRTSCADTLSLMHPVVQLLSSMKLQGYAADVVHAQGIHSAETLSSRINTESDCRLLLGGSASRAHVESLWKGVQKWRREETRRMKQKELADRKRQPAKGRKRTGTVTSSTTTTTNTTVGDSTVDALGMDIFSTEMPSVPLQKQLPVAEHPLDTSGAIGFNTRSGQTPSQFMKGLAYKRRRSDDVPSTPGDERLALSLTSTVLAHRAAADAERRRVSDHRRASAEGVIDVDAEDTTDTNEDAAAPLDGALSRWLCDEDHLAAPRDGLADDANPSPRHFSACSSTLSSVLLSLKEKMIAPRDAVLQELNCTAAGGPGVAWLMAEEPAVVAAQKHQGLAQWTVGAGAEWMMPPLLQEEDTTDMAEGEVEERITTEAAEPCSDLVHDGGRSQSACSSSASTLSAESAALDVVATPPTTTPQRLSMPQDASSATENSRDASHDDAHTTTMDCAKSDMALLADDDHDDSNSSLLQWDGEERRLKLCSDISSIISQYNLEVRRHQHHNAGVPFRAVLYPLSGNNLDDNCCPALVGMAEGWMMQGREVTEREAVEEDVELLVEPRSSACQFVVEPTSAVHQEMQADDSGDGSDTPQSFTQVSSAPTIIGNDFPLCPLPPCGADDHGVDASQHTFIASQDDEGEDNTRLLSYVGGDKEDDGSDVDDLWPEFGLDALLQSCTQNAYMHEALSQTRDLNQHDPAGRRALASPSPVPREVETVDVDDWDSDSEHVESQMFDHDDVSRALQYNTMCEEYEEECCTQPVAEGDILSDLINIYKDGKGGFASLGVDALRDLCSKLGLAQPPRSHAQQDVVGAEAASSEDDDGLLPHIGDSSTSSIPLALASGAEGNTFLTTRRRQHKTRAQRLEEEALTDRLRLVAVRALFHREVVPNALHRVSCISQLPYKRVRAADLVNTRDALTREDLERERQRAKVEEQHEINRCILSAFATDSALRIEAKCIQACQPREDGTTPLWEDSNAEISVYDRILLREPVDFDRATLLVQQHFPHIAHSRVQQLLAQHDVPIDTVQRPAEMAAAESPVPLDTSAVACSQVTFMESTHQAGGSVSPSGVPLSQSVKRRERTRQFFASKGFRTRGGYLGGGRGRGRGGRGGR